jgi:B12-binding domain/radical SAM domain protein
MKSITSGGTFHDIPNLSWKDKVGVAHHNPLSFVPDSLDDMPLDYAYPVKSVLKYRDLIGVTPFRNWLDYPITCVVTCRGCNHDCATCGGSRYAYKNSFGRERTAYRSPQLIVRDIVSIQRYLNGPVFVIGDIRQRDEDYADELLQAMSKAKIRAPIVLELFAPAGNDFFKKVSKAIPNYNIQWSPDSADDEVRHAFGKGYSNRDIENTIQNALDNGCKRFDLFFMVGLPKQTYSSVMKDASYSRALLKEFGRQKTLFPFISPLAPFVDPGSKVFENPKKYGYRMFYQTLEEHRQALKRPSWKYMLNYETEWMSRDEIVAGTYDVALAFNQLKAEYGLIAPDVANDVQTQARGAVDLMKAIDKIVDEHGFDSQRIMSLKRDADRFSSSSICQKRELHWPASSFVRNAFRIIWAFATGSESRYGD